MMKGDRKKLSMVGEAHLHNDRDQLAPSPARARCGPCGVLVHIALLAHFEMVHIVHNYLIGPSLVVGMAHHVPLKLGGMHLQLQQPLKRLHVAAPRQREDPLANLQVTNHGLHT